MTRESDLREYLAARDTPCPGCTYNLRGLAGHACPECGRSITLEELSRPRTIQLGPRFKAGFFVDCFVTLVMAAAFAGRQEGFEFLMAAGVSVCLSWGFTSLFLIAALLRMDRHDVDVVSGELTFAMWVPLVLKTTCLGALIFGGV